MKVISNANQADVFKFALPLFQHGEAEFYGAVMSNQA